MRIRESAYMALVCLFFSVYNSSAQNGAYELYNGSASNITPATSGTWDVQFLSQPKLRLQALQTGHKALFASLTECEVYDFTSNRWETHHFTIPGRNAAAIVAGPHAFFAGGARGSKHDPQFLSRIDIYNAENSGWYNSRLSEAREVGGAGTYGSVVIFAGGLNGKGYSSRVDIFNTQHATRRQHNLSQARSKMSVGATGNKIVFAGGLTGSPKSTQPSQAIDIYEVHSKTWSTALLPYAKYNMSVAVAGNKIIFAGGFTASGPSNTIDIYDAVRNTWKTATLSEARHSMSVAVVGTNVYFAGGLLNDNVLSDKLDVYDLENDQWTTSTFPSPRHGMAVSVVGSRVMFAGGYVNNLHTTTDRVEVLDIALGLWGVEHLSKARAAVTTAKYKNKVIFAGGAESTGAVASAAVDIWQANEPVRNTAYSNTTSAGIHHASNRQLHDWIYTDAHNKYIIADLWKYETHTVNISVYNTHRRTVIEKSVVPFGDTKEQIDVSDLQQGKYWVLIECAGRKPVLKQVDIKGNSDIPGFSPNTLAMAKPAATSSQFTLPQH